MSLFYDASDPRTWDGNDNPFTLTTYSSKPKTVESEFIDYLKARITDLEKQLEDSRRS